VTVVTVTPVNSSAKRLQVYSFFEDTAILVDNDNFETLDTDTQVFVFDKRNFSSVLMEIFNSGATNSLDYEFSGHPEESDTPPTITEPPEKWHVFQTGTGTLTPKTNVAKWIDDNWAWIMIRVKRTSSPNDTTVDINIRETRPSGGR